MKKAFRRFAISISAMVSVPIAACQPPMGPIGADGRIPAEWRSAAAAYPNEVAWAKQALPLGPQLDFLAPHDRGRFGA